MATEVKTGRPHGGGERAFRRLWTAGEQTRARTLRALGAGEAETFVGLLTRVAEVLLAEAVPID